MRTELPGLVGLIGVASRGDVPDAVAFGLVRLSASEFELFVRAALDGERPAAPPSGAGERAVVSHRPRRRARAS
jgi:hypothetical protein